MKKTLSIFYQGNEDQNGNEGISPDTCQNGYHQKRLLTNDGEDAEKENLEQRREWCSHWREAFTV